MTRPRQTSLHRKPPFVAGADPVRWRAGSLAALVAALVLWASSFAAIRTALRGFDPASLALVRFGFASGVLAALAAIRHPRWPAAADAVRIAIAALLLFVIYNLGLNFGERRVSAGAASLLIATAPLFTALIATAFLGERLRRNGWLGILVGFAGAAVIAVASGGGLRFGLSALAVLVAAAAEAAAFVVQKPLLARYGPIEFTTFAVWMATALMLPFAPAAVDDLRHASLEALLAAGYLGVVPTVLAYVLWAVALRRLPASRAASFLNLLPAVAILIAWVWLAEVPSAVALAGGLLALVGVALTNRPGSAVTAQPQPASVCRPHQRRDA
jgi:drug/metabolite transporter (DMT)-like permease